MTAVGNTDGLPASPRLGRWRPVLLGIVPILTTFIVVFDSAAMVMPLPAILRELGGTLDGMTWVYGAFILAFAVFLLPSARLADRYGRRLLLSCGMAVFTAASLACALAPSVGFLIGARTVQGIGAAMAEPAAFALFGTALPGKASGGAAGAQRTAFGLAAFVAPILGGAVTTGLSWRYLFWLNVLVGVLVVVGALLAVPPARGTGVPRGLDLSGLFLAGAGVYALVFALVEGARFGWGSALIAGSFLAAAVLLALFVVNEARGSAPLVRPGLFRSRLFTIGNLARGAGEFASLGVFFALSHLLQVRFGYSALVTGALLTSVIVGAVLTSPLSELLADRVDVRLLVVPGFLLVAVGTFWVAHPSPQSTWTFFIAPLVIVGAGFGALEEPVAGAALKGAPAAWSGSARNVSYTIYLLGIGLGVAVVSGVWQERFIANTTHTLSTADLSTPVNGLTASLPGGGISADPAAQVSGPGAERLHDVLQSAFTHAAGTALLSCVAVALLGAVASLFLTARSRHEAVPAATSSMNPSDA